MAEIDYIKIEHIVDRAIKPLKADIAEVKEANSKERETITDLQVEVSRNCADIVWLKRVNWLLLSTIIGQGAAISYIFIG